MGSIPRGGVNYDAVQEQKRRDHDELQEQERRDHAEQLRQAEVFGKAWQKEFGK